MPIDPPLTDSRRLTGSNVYFDATGAALETAVITVDASLIDGWRARIAAARIALEWNDGPITARMHASGASLAFAAPLDQLYAATEINEWAWCSALAFSFSSREKVPEGRMREGESIDSRSPRMKLPFNPETLEFVKNLRRESTEPEHLIWSFLRGRRLHNQKFRRQQALGLYVLDFYCHELKLAIELDGGQHDEASQLARDSRRNAFMASQNIKTLRYWNLDVVQRTAEVLADIWLHVNEALVHASENACVGESTPSSALRAPSPGRRREDQSFFHAPGHAAVWDPDIALPTLRALAAAEARPALVALIEQAQTHGLTWLLDEDALTLGEGIGSRSWSLDALPAVNKIDWSPLHNGGLHNIPVALVTGSNGKTTTVRLLAAMARAHGWRTGHSCSDGLFVDGVPIDAGDFSGPMGARRVLREPDVEAAILETARGGILRRGLAVQHAQVAIITNITADHYGEYGIHDLDELAQVKLVIARAVAAPTVDQESSERGGGLLVLNADDPASRAHAARLACRLAWFALDNDDEFLRAHRQRGGATAGVGDGRARLFFKDESHDLGTIRDMPLTASGRAVYNISNLLGASLAAAGLGIAPAQIAGVLAQFGSTHEDNPGRLQHWSLGGVEIWLDYAHNPDGLRGLLAVARSGCPHGRLGLMLGQAGNRTDADIRMLATVSVAFKPACIVIKETEGLLRGRAIGETVTILRDELLAHGMAADAIALSTDEALATRAMLGWARSGDVLVLPIHGKTARDEISAWLDRLLKSDWQPGQSLAD